MTSPDYGMQAFMWWRPEVAHRDLGLIRDAGFRWVKQDFAWREIEGAAKGAFDWSRADRIVQMAHDDFGLKIIGLSPTGGPMPVAMNDVEYLRGMYEAMGGSSQGYFDVLGAHAPGFKAPPEVSRFACRHGRIWRWKPPCRDPGNGLDD